MPFYVPCKFCERESISRCCWKVERRQKTIASNLRAGDHIVGAEDYHYRVTAIVPQQYGILVYAQRLIDGEMANGLLKPDRSVEALQERPCDQAACEFHCRELDDGAHHCRDHWLQQVSEWSGEDSAVMHTRAARALNKSLRRDMRSHLRQGV